jgi:lipopolysaccharide export system protein LptC
MAMHDNTYSRAVALLKVLLPLLALAILSTLFLLSRTIEPSQKLPYADVDAKEFAREQRIGSPNYTGTTSDGAAVKVTAQSARPQLTNPKIMSATKLQAEIKQTDGTVIDVVALDGIFDTNEQTAVLTGGVVVTSSTGYTLTSEKLNGLLDGSAAETDTDVVIEGPEIRIDAGSMKVKLSSRKSAPKGYDVVFNGGVKLVYTPKEQSTGSQ